MLRLHQSQSTRVRRLTTARRAILMAKRAQSHVCSLRPYLQRNTRACPLRRTHRAKPRYRFVQPYRHHLHPEEGPIVIFSHETALRLAPTSEVGRSAPSLLMAKARRRSARMALLFCLNPFLLETQVRASIRSNEAFGWALARELSRPQQVRT